MTTWIQTRTGLAFEPLDPKPEAIELVDIAWALAHVCRFTGHVRSFYSVAEHSIRVAQEVSKVRRDYPAPLYALLHDASEAYLADVAAPLKCLPAFAAYRQIEERVQVAILQRFGLPPAPPDDVVQAIKHADAVCLLDERDALLVSSPRSDGWPTGITRSMGKPAPPGDLYWPAPVHHARALGPMDARRHFEAFFFALGGKE